MFLSTCRHLSNEDFAHYILAASHARRTLRARSNMVHVSINESLIINVIKVLFHIRNEGEVVVITIFLIAITISRTLLNYRKLEANKFIADRYASAVAPRARDYAI